MRFVFLGPGLCLQLPSHLASRRRGCCSARGSRHQGPQRTRTSWSLPVRLSPRGYLRPTRDGCVMPGAHRKWAALRRPMTSGPRTGRLGSPTRLAGFSPQSGLVPPDSARHGETIVLDFGALRRCRRQHPLLFRCAAGPSNSKSQREAGTEHQSPHWRPSRPRLLDLAGRSAWR